MAKITIGLTGGIASGKSVASDILRLFGAEIIDADIVSRQVGQGEIAQAFPDCTTGGALDRRKLRKVVFGDERKLKLLNSITHPLIVAEILRKRDEINGVAVIVAPLLLEVGLHKYCDKVITVTAQADTRIKRIVERDNITESLAYNMIEAQASDEARIAIADYVVQNDGTEDELRGRLKEWWSQNIENVY